MAEFHAYADAAAADLDLGDLLVAEVDPEGVDEETQAVSLATLIEALARLGGTMRWVNHGATAGTARPTGTGPVYWIGSVQPTNAAAGDLWLGP